MHDADTLVELWGVSGRDPDIGAAADLVVSAYQTRNMGTLCFAVAEFVDVVRRVASRRYSGRDRPQNWPRNTVRAPADIAEVDTPE
jgi:hypothetical protein